MGWGTSGAEKNYEDVPYQADIQSISGSECFSKASFVKWKIFCNHFDLIYKQEYHIGAIYSERMFCAKGNGSGPCSGDSGKKHCQMFLMQSLKLKVATFAGGGFFVQHDQKWILKGIVSATSASIDGSCDIGRYALYTKVSRFVTWMNETISKANFSSFI